MADLAWEGSVEPASLRRALRHALRRFAPDLRVIAEEFLGETTAMDLLAVGSTGEVVCIRIAPPASPANSSTPASTPGDALLLTRGLADIAFIAPRVRDLAKLSADVGIEPTAAPRVLLVAERFGSEVRAASRVVASDQMQLIEYRCLRDQGQLTLLLEAAGNDPAISASAGAGAELDSTIRTASRSGHPQRRRSEIPSDGPQSGHTLIDPPSSSGFRTGLTDADLRLESAVPLGSA